MNKRTGGDGKHHANILVVSAALLAAVVVAVALCAGVGVVHYDWRHLWQSPIVLQLRLPREVLSVVVGASLSVCGAVYQSVFRNPLTDPYVLGISSGASLGAAIAILIGLEASLWGVSGMALCTALLTMLVIFKVASMGNRLHTTTLLLTGVCLTFLITAINSLLMALHQEKMESVIFWTMGSFASSSWVDVAIVAPVVVVGFVVVVIHAKDLNLLLVGSETAQTLGVDVERVRRRLLIVTTLMVAFSVACCGVIGFVGLVVPHCVRLVCGADNRRIVPYSFFGGGLFLLLCDTVARTLLPPNELPVGSITSLFGAPMFIYLLYKSKTVATR